MKFWKKVEKDKIDKMFEDRSDLVNAMKMVRNNMGEVPPALYKAFKKVIDNLSTYEELTDCVEVRGESWDGKTGSWFGRIIDNVESGVYEEVTTNPYHCADDLTINLTVDGVEVPVTTFNLILETYIKSLEDHYKNQYTLDQKAIKREGYLLFKQYKANLDEDNSGE